LIVDDGAAPAGRRDEPVLGRGVGTNGAGGAGTLQTSGKEICIPVIDLLEYAIGCPPRFFVAGVIPQ
jgi:hypothetical protein